MVALFSLSLLLSVGPDAVGLLVIDREAAAAGPALMEAARNQAAKLSGVAKVDIRRAKRTVSCNLETFRSMGVDLALCGVSLSDALQKLYVIESSLDAQNRVELTFAVFDRSRFVLYERQPARKIAVESTQTYAAVLDQVR